MVFQENLTLTYNNQYGRGGGMADATDLKSVGGKLP